MSKPRRKARPWSDRDTTKLRELAPLIERRQMSQAEAAKILKRTISSVEGKLRTMRISDALGPVEEGQARYDKPEYVASDDGKHLRLIAKASRKGFGWWPEAVMEQVYKLEAPIRLRREFWRAA